MTAETDLRQSMDWQIPHDVDATEFHPAAFFVAASRWLAGLVALAALCVLLIWRFEVLAVARTGATAWQLWVREALLRMRPTTAIGLIFGAAALFLVANPGPASALRRRQLCGVGKLTATLLIGLAFVVLARNAGVLSSPFDGWWRTFWHLSGPDDGPTSTLVACGFLIVGCAVLLIDVQLESGHAPAEYLAIGLAGLMAIPLVGYLFSISSMVKVASSIGVTPITPLLFIALGAGIMLARPRHLVMRVWNSNAPGGHLLRRLLPKSLLLLLLLDLVVEWGARHNFYSPESVSALVILVAGAWLSVLFWRAGALLNREHDVRLHGEVELAETHALLRAVSDNTPDAIYVKNAAGHYVFANPAALKLLGKSAAEVIGRAAPDLFPTLADAQRAAYSDAEVQRTRQSRMVEETLALPDGMRVFYTTKAPWIDAHGAVHGVVCISTDATEQKRVEDALREHEMQLEALVAERTGEVSELMAHLEATREEEKRAIARELHDDLGSALTALNMHLAILFQQMPRVDAFIERSTHIKGLLAAITQTTRRIQVGLRPDKLDTFGIKAAITELAEEFQNYSGVLCRASLPDETLSYAPQIDIALYRMVQEALNNIAKHAHARAVDVVLDDVDDEIHLTVRDDGVGMPADRMQGSTTHGLRSLRERAGYLGGEVRVASSPGRGTQISVRLPKASRPRTAAQWLENKRAGGAAG